MENIDIKKGYVSTEYGFNQERLGGVEVKTIYYDHSKELGLQIRIFDKVKDNIGWGKAIFDGSLEELITLINNSNVPIFSNMNEILEHVS